MDWFSNIFASIADSPTRVPKIHISKSERLFRFFSRQHPLPTSNLRKQIKKGEKNPDGDTTHLDETNIRFAGSRKGRKEILSALSGATSLALSTLQNTASLAPVPYLSEAAGLALGIWNAIQNTRNAKSSLLALGEDACTLVCIVWMTCDEVLLHQRGAATATTQAKLEVEVETGEQVNIGNDIIKAEKKREAEAELSEVHNEVEVLNPQLKNNLKRLCSTLSEISAFATQTASRNVILRFLTSDKDEDKVAEYQAKIKGALDLFALQANITVQQIISRIEVQQRVIQEQMQIGLASSEKDPVSSTSAPTSTLKGSPARPVPTRTTLGDSPAIFSFAGATFQTGNTAPTSKSHYKSKPTTASTKFRAKPET